MKKYSFKKATFGAIASLGFIVSASSLVANELTNPGFEQDVSGSYGNNVSPRLNIAPWVSLGRHNVVKVDGVGGFSWYGSNGPASDASTETGFRHYLDMQDSAGAVYQQFTTPNNCSGDVTFGGYFSTRGNSSGEAHIEIREGVGDQGNLIGTTAVINLATGNSETDPWTPANFTANLNAATTYSFLIWMDNNLNFDEGYVNFLTGPCQDDSVLDDPLLDEPVIDDPVLEDTILDDPIIDDLVIDDPIINGGMCLEVKHQISCTESGWEVSLSHDSSSILQPDQYNVQSITNGVSVMGTSPRFLLNGAQQNTAVDLLVYGTQSNQGSLAGTDLCCEETRIHVDIPNQQCGIECADNEELLNGACTIVAQTEPEIIPNCSSNIVVIVDESGSIADNSNDPWSVRSEVANLLKGFKGHGSKATVIHFDTNARLVDPMTEIATAPFQERSFSAGYNPLSGQTNWEAGLKLALAEINANPGPELVFFITDGQPNRYLDNNGAVQTGSEVTSVSEAVVIANQIKAAGARNFSIGVGNISSSSTAVANLQAIASSGDAITGSMSELAGIVADYTAQSCADIHLQKMTVSDKNIDLRTKSLATVKPKFQIMITNNTPNSLTNIVVEDALPAPQLTFNSMVSTTAGTSSQTGNIITWNIPSLAANTTQSLSYKTNVSGVALLEKVFNYTQVISVDQPIASNTLLASSTQGPLNLNDRDEAKDYIYVYQSPVPEPCIATASDTEKCLIIRKEIAPGEGNCSDGQACEFILTIANYSTQAYTNTLNISDSYTSSGSVPISSIQASNNAPTQICSVLPTSIPFTCTQTDDIPANTTWQYNVVTNWATDASKNCFTVNNITACAQRENPTNRSHLAVTQDKQLILSKSGPTRCKAGGVCHFTIGVENPTDKVFDGPFVLIDQPSKMFGRVQGASKGWSCLRAKNQYQCLNPDLKLAANSSTQFALSLSVPSKLSGKVSNCIEGQLFNNESNSLFLLQGLLKAAGFNPNGIDGILGYGTKKAMKRYAMAHGLKNDDTRSLISHLQSKLPKIDTNKSCTNVIIDKPKRQCKVGTVKRFGECVQIKVNSKSCSQGANWNGKQCIVCEEGSQWNNQRKSCDFPEVSVVCKKGETLEGDRCIQAKKPQCIPFITRYSPTLGICVPNISIGIGLGSGGSHSEEKDLDQP